jgi:SAM-dependent methyltransferase
MSRWDRTVTETTEDAKRFWAEASLETLQEMMAPRRAWEGWLRVAAGVVTSPGSVFEPGCGIGLLTECLPPGCTYYGCDVNPAYVSEARRARSGQGNSFEVRDLEDVLGSGETFDWVIVTSLFGMFPEPASYEMIDRLWAAARRGLSVTTVNKRRFGTHRLLRFDFTSHDPDELLAAGESLPEARRVELHHGAEFPQFRGHHWSRGLAMYVWRAEAS